MKKKYLKSLKSIENWLTGHGPFSDNLKEAFDLIRFEMEKIVETETEQRFDGPLPIPQEIANTPDVFALYSDGGCRGNPGPGSFAFVIQSHDGAVITEGVEFEMHTTNNKMELSGPLKGLRALKDMLPDLGKDALLVKVKVITDSKYVVEGMSSWVNGWKARGWKKADGKVPENLELWQELDQVNSSFFHVEWMWVKGHAGHPQNEYCDRKANQLMDENLN